MAMSAVTSMKFRQIDFLRLFRLCKSMGLVNRKRKMPSEYLRDGECKNACKRLIVLVAREVYKDYQIHAGYGSINIYAPHEIGQQLRQVVQDVLYPDYYGYGNNRNRTRITLSQEGSTRLNALHNFEGFGNGHVNLSFPNNFAFNYRSYNGTSGSRDSFYRCALDCIAFKKFWEDSVALIIAAHKEAVSATQSAAKNLQELEKKAKEQEQERLQRTEAQQRFNEALSSYLGRGA